MIGLHELHNSQIPQPTIQNGHILPSYGPLQANADDDDEFEPDDDVIAEGEEVEDDFDDDAHAIGLDFF